MEEASSDRLIVSEKHQVRITASSGETFGLSSDSDNDISEMASHCLSFLEQRLGSSSQSVTIDTSLVELSSSSVILIELYTFINDTYDVGLTMSSLMECRHMRDVGALIYARLKKEEEDKVHI